jgi:hypothetical protein
MTAAALAYVALPATPASTLAIETNEVIFTSAAATTTSTVAFNVPVFVNPLGSVPRVAVKV